MGKATKPHHVAVLGVSSLVLLLLLLLSSAVQDAAAMEGAIDYGAIRADAENGRNKDLFRPDNPEDIANNYTRGCEKIEGCRNAAAAIQ